MKKLVFNSAFKNKIFKASVGLISINLFAKVLGYGEKLLLAKYFGTGYQVDVYTVVITLIFSFFYFFREIVEPSILRIFLEKEKEEAREGWSIFNFGIRIILGVTLIISFLIYTFPEKTVGIFASGFEGEKFLLAVSLLKKTIVSCIFLSLSTLTSIILNAKKYFVFPALGDLVFKLIIILGFLSIDFENGILGVGMAIIIASLLKLGLHLSLLYKNLSFSKLNISRDSKNQMLKLSVPLLVGVVFSQLSGIIDNNFASKLQDGAISSISYAKKIIELPIVLLPYVLSVVIFPFFSEMSIKKETLMLKKLFTESITLMVIIFLPLSLFYILQSHQIVELIFKRGAFDEQSVDLTTLPLFVFSFGLLAFAIESILVIYYFSNADTKTPIIVGIVCVILNILMTWSLLDRLGYMAIPFAYVVQKSIKCVWLMVLKRSHFIFEKAAAIRNFLNFCLALSVFGLLGFFSNCLMQNHIFFSNNTLDNMLKLFISFMLPFGCYFLMLWKSGLMNTLKLFVK